MGWLKSWSIVLWLALTLAVGVWVLGTHPAVARPLDVGPGRLADEAIPLAGGRLNAILTVCPAGPPACGYSSIQAAVDAAAPGDEIRVATGVYTQLNNYGGLAQVVYLSKTLTIRGGYTVDFVEPPDPVANPTTLDAQGGGRVVYITGDVSPTVEGLQITGGDAAGLGGWPWGGDAGGGVYVINATALISHCQIFGNFAPQYGGGLLSFRGRLTLEDNTVSDNTTGFRGGGLLLQDSTATFNYNTVATNTAGYYGGGLGLQGSNVVLDRNTISGNTSSDWGGGLWMWLSDATLSGNTISGNTADRSGGAAMLFLSNATFTHNIISSNSAGGSGGLLIWASNATLNSNIVTTNTAAHVGGLGVEDSVVALNDNIIAANFASNSSAGGLDLQESDAVLNGNIFFANEANGGCGGLAVGGDNNATLDRNIISANTANGRGGGLCLYNNSDVTLSENVISANAAGQGSGLYIREDSPRLLHNTIARNREGDGVGIYVDWDDDASTAWLTNTILVSHTVGVYVASGNTVILEGTLWGNETDWAGPGTIITGTHDYWGDPAFVDPDEGDYHIRGTSAARDVGVTPVPAESAGDDMDGQLRPMDRGYDLGADEYPGAGLALAKPLFAANRGEVFTYTISVTGVGLENATGVALTDTLDLWQRPIAAVSSQGSTVVDPSWGGTVACAAGDLVTGTSVLVTVTAEISAGVPLRQPMTGALVARANETANNLQVALYAQNCHVRLNDASTEYPTLQAAVDAASPGDLVKVAGLCLGVGRRGGQVQQAYLDESLAVQGGYTTTNWLDPDPEANPTILDGLEMGRVLYATGSEVNLTLEGLRITGGDAIGMLNRDWKDQVGGGVYVSDATVTISHCRVFSNTAYSGGGLWLEGGVGLLRGNDISNNSARYTAAGAGAGGKGGGLHLGPDSDVTLRGNAISTNTTNWSGGGLYSWFSDVTLDGNTISANVGSYEAGGLCSSYSSATLTENTFSVNSTSQFGGGALLLGGDALLTGNVFVSNTSEYVGGGLFSQQSSIEFERNIVSANTADDCGGGLCLSTGSDAVLANNLIADNQAYDQGSGLCLRRSSLRLLHNTIARNSGGAGSGVYLHYRPGPSTIAFTNTILVSHSVGIYVEGGSTAILETTLWGNETDWAGPGIIIRAHDYWGNPDFLDPDAGDYHVGPGSMALDRGVDAGVVVDIDGDPRPIGPGYDLGMDEAPAAVPGIPMLLVPPDGTITTTQMITLTWQAGAGSPPVGYNLDLDGAIVTTTDTTSCTLLPLGVHTWTVRAFNQVGYSDWAVPWTVEVVDTLPPAVPVLLWPPDGHITTTQAITLAWQAGPGAPSTGYDLDLDGSVVTTTSTTWPTVLSFGVHTWTVRAFNAAGYSDWAAPWTVVITQTPSCTPVTGVDLTVVTPGTVYAGDTVQFSADLAPDDLTRPYTYTVQVDGQTVVYPTAGDDDPLPFTHTFPFTGSYVVEVAVWNCGMGDPITGTVEVTVYEPGVCVPLETVAILGEVAGYLGVPYTFTTRYAPAGASLPISYTWDDGGTGAGSVRTFEVPGPHTLAVTATNCADTSVTDTHTITIGAAPVCTQVESVDLSLLTPPSIYAGDTAQFSADLAPDDLTLSYTYTVHLDGTTLVTPQAGSTDPLVFSHTFPVTGVYIVEVAVWNCDIDEAGAVTDTVGVEVVEPGGYRVYLPVVMR